MLRALAALAGELPAADPRRAEVALALERGLRARNPDLVAGRAIARDHALEALLLVERVFADEPAFLAATDTPAALDALGRLVSEDAAPLSPGAWGLFLERAAR